MIPQICVGMSGVLKATERPRQSKVTRKSKPSPGPERASYIIRPVQKAIEVLKCVGQLPEPMALKEIAGRVGLPKTTVFRYLRTFESAGMIVHDQARDVYRIDTRIVGMINLGLEIEHLRQASLPYMRNLQELSAETVNLAVVEATDIVYIDIIEPSHSIKFHARVGGRDPVHTTSLGKAILAHLPKEAQGAALPRALRRRTRRSVQDFNLLMLDLEQVRSRGYAEDNEENEEGATALGSPLFNTSGAAVGAISVAAPSYRLGEERKADIVRQLIAAANCISAALGFEGVD
jgi:DNA-binding IclR family transcriptional regulator